ncbi:unnamed protein product [Dibothriocephalus latus]|uniref:Uncharacterized protein n=1 Tax=Dibothriocephalus latus TaxID=60516 RepID=A0A3P7P5K1_DIBLA|nr:unnamed protein product [Dibothriocephalus latus]
MEWLSCLPQEIDSYLMSLHLPIRWNKVVTVIWGYQEPMTIYIDLKFYEDLHDLIMAILQVNSFIALDVHVAPDLQC